MMQHCGSQTLRNTLRERYWIVGNRVAVRKVVSDCQRCRRHEAENIKAPEAPLPENRIRDATAFEVVGMILECHFS